MREPLKKCNKVEQFRTDGLVLTIIASCGLLLSGGVIAGIVYLFLVALRPPYSESSAFAAGVRVQAGLQKGNVGCGLGPAHTARTDGVSRDMRAKAPLQLEPGNGNLRLETKKTLSAIPD
jgi:hypothetical protein